MALQLQELSSWKTWRTWRAQSKSSTCLIKCKVLRKKIYLFRIVSSRNTKVREQMRIYVNAINSRVFLRAEESHWSTMATSFSLCSKTLDDNAIMAENNYCCGELHVCCYVLWNNREFLSVRYIKYLMFARGDFSKIIYKFNGLSTTTLTQNRTTL